MADSNSPILLSGEKTVTTSGTEVALGAAKVKALTIIAKKANTGQIYVGGSDVAVTTNDGLDAGEVLEIATKDGLIDLATLYIDADVNGEGVDFYATKVA